MLFIYNKSDYG